MSDKLIVYFSASGVTAKRAEELANVTGSDAYRIEPAKPYTAADLNWNDKSSRSSMEMKDPSSRPAIRNGKIDLSSYSTIYIGFPVWWGVAPRAVNTFIESNDFTGKDIVIFATSGGSGISFAVKDLEKNYPGLKIVKSKLLNSKVSEDII